MGVFRVRGGEWGWNGGYLGAEGQSGVGMGSFGGRGREMGLEWRYLGIKEVNGVEVGVFGVGEGKWGWNGCNWGHRG